MGKIKKILENELIGGTQTTDVYPVTSTKAVYDENNKRLDEILSASTEAIDGVTNKVTELEDKVQENSGILEGLCDAQKVQSKNIFKGDTKLGYISDSYGLNESVKSVVTEPIEVKPNYFYYIKRNSVIGAGGSYLRCLVNATDETGKSALNPSSGSKMGISVDNKAFRVPSDCHYIQAQLTFETIPADEDYKKMMLEEIGAEYNPSFTPSPYEPYRESYEVKVKLSALPNEYSKIPQLVEDMYGKESVAQIESSNTISGRYIDGSKTDGSYQVYESLSIAFFAVRKGCKYQIHADTANNAAAWELGYSEVADMSLKAVIIEDAGKGTNSAFDYEYEADKNGFIVVGFATNTSVPTVKEISLVGSLKQDVEELKIDTIYNAFSNKKVLFFGDSLVAASSSYPILSQKGGFVRLIAERNKCEYRGYLDNAVPTQTDDEFVGFKNIARDGTTIRTRTEPAYLNQSVNERVHAWVRQGTCDLAVIQGGTNDYNTHKGVITENYDGGYDVTTSLGALEDILYYVTGLGIKVCFLIMHKVNYVSENFYDDYKKVCEKWGVPYLDMNKSAGFNFGSTSNPNLLHGRLYSISPKEYSPTETYNLDSKVKYQDKSYKCLDNGVIGVLPTDTSKWELVSDFAYDLTHLNDAGHEVVSHKVEEFLKSI